MHAQASWVSHDTPVSEVAKLMKKDDVGAVPVGKNDRLVGMLSLGDVSHSVSRDLSGELLRAVTGHHL